MEDYNRLISRPGRVQDRRKTITEVASKLAPLLNISIIPCNSTLEQALKRIILERLHFKNVIAPSYLEGILAYSDKSDIVIADCAFQKREEVMRYAGDIPIIGVSPSSKPIDNTGEDQSWNEYYSRALYDIDATVNNDEVFSEIEKERLLLGIECAAIEKFANDKLETLLDSMTGKTSRGIEKLGYALTGLSGFKLSAMKNYLRLAELLVSGDIQIYRDIASGLYEINRILKLQEFEDNYNIFFNSAERSSTLYTLRQAIAQGNAHVANAYGLIVAKHAQEEGAKIIQMNNEIVMSRKLSMPDRTRLFAKMAKSPSKLEREKRLINLYNDARRVINNLGQVYGSAIRIPKLAAFPFNQIDRPMTNGDVTQMDVLLLKYIPGESFFSYAHSKRQEARDQGDLGIWTSIRGQLLENTLQAQFSVIAMGLIIAQKDPNIVDIVHSHDKEKAKEYYRNKVLEKFVGHDSSRAIILDQGSRSPPQTIIKYLRGYRYTGRDDLPPLQPYLAGVLWNVTPPNFHGALSHILHDDQQLDTYRTRILEDITPVLDIVCVMEPGIGIDLPQRNLILTQAGIDSLRTKGKLYQNDVAAIDREWIRDTPYLFEAVAGWESSLARVGEKIPLQKDIIYHGEVVASAGQEVSILHYALTRFAEELPKKLKYYIPNSSGFKAPDLQFPSLKETYKQFCAAAILQEMSRAGAFAKYLTSQFDSPVDRANHFRGLFSSLESIAFHSRELSDYYPPGSDAENHLKRLAQTIDEISVIASKKYNKES